MASNHSGLLLLRDQPRGSTGSAVGSHAVWQGPEPHSPAHPGSKPAWSHLHAQAGPLRRFLPPPPTHGGHPNAGCGLSGGPWGGPAHCAPTHTAHGLDGESTIFLQRHRNCGGPHQPTRLPFLEPTTASLELAPDTQPPQDGRHCITVPTPMFSPPPRLPAPPQLPPAQRRHHRRPLAYGDVFVDDKILLTQGTPLQLHRFKCQALHINDWIFRANDFHDNPTVRKEPISKSKLLKGTPAGPPPR